MPTLEARFDTKPASPRTRPTLKNRLLSVSPNAEDHATLRSIVHGLNWQVSSVKTVCEASERLLSERYSAILCEGVLGDGTWKDLLSETSGSPLIVTSRLADEYLWSEVLNLGGYDVLSKPFSRPEVVHVLTTVALRSRHDARVGLAAAG